MILGTKTKKVWNAGNVCNLKLYDSKQAAGSKFASFDLRTENCGFIKFKTFDNNIAQMLQNGQFIIIKDMYIKKSSYLNQQAVKVWNQDLVVCVVEIMEAGTPESVEKEIKWE